MHLQPRWALFISGQGSNMSAVLDQKLDAGSVALVVSSSSTNFGLKRARRLGVPTLVLDKKIDWSKLQEHLVDFKITHIFLLGFMKIVPESFLDFWQRPILNVHPSLLPAYPGLAALERAFADRAPLGVTVHQVIPDVDAGAIVLQKKITTVQEQACYNDIESKAHQLEYQVVRKSIKVASCWT